MNIYEVRHDGHYLGGLSIVIAVDEAHAIELTKAAIPTHGLRVDGIRVIQRLDQEMPRCYVLDDGDY